MAVTLKGQTAVYEGTSTDTKPIDADNNAIFKELDTGIRYYYDGTDWNEIPSSGGGGGGTGTDNYNELNNKPSINGTVLSGNKSLDNLGIQAKLTFDSAPTEDSENPVESGGVYSALADKADSDNVYKLALSDADLLPANTDLDNVKTVGCYYVLASATVSTITNRPTNNTSAFRLTVEYAAGEKRARQIYQEFNSFDKYIRVENSSNVFSEWKKVECDLSTKQNTISDLSTIRSGAAAGATAVQPADVIAALATKQDVLTTEQLAAVNSGIDSDDVAQITTNKNNILSLSAKSQKTISSSGNTSKLRLTLDTSAMSNANRGSLLLSIPFQTSSYDNALLMIAIGNDSFLGVQRLDNSNNSMVTSWALSENNTILDITLRAQPWSAPVAFPMTQVVPPITYSWES